MMLSAVNRTSWHFQTYPYQESKGPTLGRSLEGAVSCEEWDLMMYVYLYLHAYLCLYLYLCLYPYRHLYLAHNVQVLLGDAWGAHDNECH